MSGFFRRNFLRGAAALLLLAVGWLAAGPSAAVAAPLEGVHQCTYGSPGTPSVTTNSPVERGPPTTCDRDTAHFADDHRSSGASTRSAVSTTYAYNGPATWVQVARVTSTIPEQAQTDGGALSPFAGSDVAANAGRALTHADLNPAQLSNLTRYTKKLPAGAEPTIITRGADGAVQLSTKVPGRVPGSYATYDKVVDASGTTTGYTKTTVLPDGTILHTKDKLNP